MEGLFESHHYRHSSIAPIGNDTVGVQDHFIFVFIKQPLFQNDDGRAGVRTLANTLNSFSSLTTPIPDQQQRQ
jgi:hypothetical protein